VVEIGLEYNYPAGYPPAYETRKHFFYPAQKFQIVDASSNTFPAGETIDAHFLRSTRFYDTLDGGGFFSDGFAWNAGLSVLYHPAVPGAGPAPSRSSTF
jgi:hypothetical protein